MGQASFCPRSFIFPQAALDSEDMDGTFRIKYRRRLWPDEKAWQHFIFDPLLRSIYQVLWLRESTYLRSIQAQCSVLIRILLAGRGQADFRAGFAKLAKGAGLKIPSRRSSRVRIPYPASEHIDFDF